MRYLGIDYGKKRIGIALSDPGGTIAFPKGVIENRGRQEALRVIKAMIRREGVGGVVVGLPRGVAKKATRQTNAVESFIGFLKKNLKISIFTEDEFLTTRIAKASDSGGVDAVAAALILQTHLDKLSFKS